MREHEQQARATMRLIELARAKVNLTLRILGKRADGYHELDSIVAFGDIGDVLSLEPATSWELVAPGLDVPPEQNLINRAAAAFADVFGPQNYRLTLDKRLPTAAGLGGGSADAAATLRLLVQTLPPPRDVSEDIIRAVRLIEMAELIGSDVPVCFANKIIHMRGRGEHLTPLPPIRPLPAVLVNAMEPVPPNKTAAVFKALAAAPLRPGVTYSVEDGAAVDATLLQALIMDGANDLQRPATDSMPEVDVVLARLGQHTGVLVERMSGAGPTCFGLFETTEQAATCSARLQAAHPTWWVVATTLR